MSAVVKKYNHCVIIICLLFALIIDSLSNGTHYQAYSLPITIASFTLRLRAALAVATLSALLSILFVPITVPMGLNLAQLAMLRVVLFNLIAFLLNILIEKETSKKDGIIRELSTHIDLNKTLHNILLNDSKTAIEVTNAQGTIVAWNQTAIELTGVAEAIGKHHTQVFSQSVETGQNQLVDTITLGKECLDQEITLYFPPKAPIVALVTTYRLMDEHNSAVGAVAIYRDITQKKSLERKMHQAEKFTALGQMAAGLAHEVRNPLTTIKGFLQLMSPEYLTPKYSEYRELMLAEVNRTDNLISDFVLLANPSAPVFKAVDLTEFVELMFELLRGSAMLKNIILLNQVPSLPLVYLDCEQFKHLLISLYNNSVEAMPEGGAFGVQAVKIGEKVQLKVWDTGHGIPPELIDKVFDPFFSTKEDRSGLGLSVSYQIVANHRGQISVNSCPGKGTSFIILLPLGHPGAAVHSIPA